VIATGNLALRAGLLHLDSAQVGVDLAHHVAYIDDTLPTVLAGRAPAPAPRAAAAPEPKHRSGPARPAASPAAAPAADWWQSPPRKRAAQRITFLNTPRRPPLAGAVNPWTDQVARRLRGPGLTPTAPGVAATLQAPTRAAHGPPRRSPPSGGPAD
jgi:hypothetical protein